jgi:hypothetical protein
MEQFLSFTLVGVCCPLLLFSPFVDGSFKLCNNGLCTSWDVEAEFNYPISKKKLQRQRYKLQNGASKINALGGFNRAQIIPSRTYGVVPCISMNTMM